MGETIQQRYTVQQSYRPREENQVVDESHTTTTYLELKRDYNNVPDISQITTFPSIENSSGKAGYVDRVQEKPDYQVTAEDSIDSLIFYNECIFFDTAFKSTETYYFHGKIKRMSTSQTFYIKLLKNTTDPETKDITQYIKTINVAGGKISEWVDVEFIFTPLGDYDFNGIVFELQRDASDYRVESRYAIIAYLELSKVINISEFSSIKPIKLGVQSRPGLLMCINGEEIRTGRTGIYEIKNGIIRTTFFAVPHAADEVAESGQEISIFKQWQVEVNAAIEEILDQEDPNPEYRGLYEAETQNEQIVQYVPTKDTRVESLKKYYNPEVISDPQGNPHDSGYCEKEIEISGRIIYKVTNDTTPVIGKEYFSLIETIPTATITPTEAEELKSKIHSVAFYKTSKKRTTDSFVLDYMY